MIHSAIKHLAQVCLAAAAVSFASLAHAEDIIRVHDVAATIDALKVRRALS